MSTKLQAVYDLLIRLRDEGVEAICCGGAARDTYLGKVPKDYDFVILRDTSHGPLEEAISNATGYPVRELGNAEEYVSDERGLDHVYESRCGYPGAVVDTIVVQFLVYCPAKTASFAGDPYNVVEDFDNTLNYAWFEEHQGRLLVRVHPEFPSIQYGVRPVHRDGAAERRAYMRAKFPEFY